MKVLRRDKGKSTATQQLLAKKGHHGMPIPVHLSNAKALSLRTRNGDCCEVPDPKLKGTRAQERPDKSSRIQDSSEVIGYVLIKPKPPLHSVSKIMNIADALIDQIRQPHIIDGCQVCNPPLIKSSQQDGGPNSGYKRAHGQISTSESTTQVSINCLRKAHSFIKKLYGRVPKRLQPNPTISQRKILSKTATKIGNHLRTRLVFLLGKAD